MLRSQAALHISLPKLSIITTQPLMTKTSPSDGAVERPYRGADHQQQRQQQEGRAPQHHHAPHLPPGAQGGQHLPPQRQRRHDGGTGRPPARWRPARRTEQEQTWEGLPGTRSNRRGKLAGNELGRAAGAGSAFLQRDPVGRTAGPVAHPLLLFILSMTREAFPSIVLPSHHRPTGKGDITRGASQTADLPLRSALRTSGALLQRRRVCARTLRAPHIPGLKY